MIPVMLQLPRHPRLTRHRRRPDFVAMRDAGVTAALLACAWLSCQRGPGSAGTTESASTQEARYSGERVLDSLDRMDGCAVPVIEPDTAPTHLAPAVICALLNASLRALTDSHVVVNPGAATGAGVRLRILEWRFKADTG